MNQKYYLSKVSKYLVFSLFIFLYFLLKIFFSLLLILFSLNSLLWSQFFWSNLLYVSENVMSYFFSFFGNKIALTIEASQYTPKTLIFLCLNSLTCSLHYFNAQLVISLFVITANGRYRGCRGRKQFEQFLLFYLVHSFFKQIK